MNVSYSDNVTNTIGYLRSNVYDKDKFKSEFRFNLNRAINASNILFNPDQFGGWIVSANVENTSDDRVVPEAATYTSKVADALVDSIMLVDRSVSCSDIAANLVNVIITGPDSIIVKL